MKEASRKRVGKKGAGRARRQLRPMARAIESLFGAQAEPLCRCWDCCSIPNRAWTRCWPKAAGRILPGRAQIEAPAPAAAGKTRGGSAHSA